MPDPLTDIAEIQNQKAKLLEGSCSWVLKNAAYIEWINSNCSKVLLIHGKPGKGKTMIAISLIESLHSNISNSSLGAYIFCDNTIDKRNTTLAVMKSLLYQILSQQPGLLKLLLRDFEIQKARLFSSLEAVWRILQNVLNNSSLREVYFVVDGLDECKVDSLEPFLLLVESYQHQKPSDARTN